MSTKKEFLHGTTIGLQIAFAGFLIAIVGAIAGFSGFHVNERWLSLLGFVLVASGVFVGFVGVAYGWKRETKRAVKGSIQATNEMRSRLQQITDPEKTPANGDRHD